MNSGIERSAFGLTELSRRHDVAEHVGAAVDGDSVLPPLAVDLELLGRLDGLFD